VSVSDVEGALKSPVLVIVPVPLVTVHVATVVAAPRYAVNWTVWVCATVMVPG
jgi:hypothetical protein